MSFFFAENTACGVKQSAWVRNTGVSPISVTLPQSVSAGSLIVVLLHKATTNNAAGDVTDTIAPYALDGSWTGDANVKIGVYSRRQSSAVASLTVTATNTAATHAMSMCVYELYGMTDKSWFDSFTVRGPVTSTGPSTNTFATAGKRGVVVVIEVDGAASGTVSKTAIAPYQISANGAAHEDNAATFWSVTAMHRVLDAAVIAERAALTLGSSQAWTMFSAFYKAAN